MRRTSLAIAMLAFATLLAGAAGDFPLASCKGWNGTVVERDGIDTTHSTMREIVIEADLQEYCERDPGGEIKQCGGKLTTAQCVANYLRSEGQATMAARANCRGARSATGTATAEPRRFASRSARTAIPPAHRVTRR